MSSDDWPNVSDVYAAGIATGDATFETEVPTWKDFDGSHHRVLRLVAVEAGRVIGWAAAVPVSRRRAYCGVVEASVYVSDTTRGRGVGRALLSALIELAEQCGVWTIQSGILPENTSSRALHLQCGFREVGRRRRAGYGDGRWRDVVLFERSALGGGNDRPFLRLASTTGQDAERVREMLEDAGLPPQGLDACWALLVADDEVSHGVLRGAAALERHHAPGAPPAHLLRSVVVDPAARRTGLGRRLVARTLQIADTAEAGRAEVALLTMSDEAGRFFRALGFGRADRADLPAAVFTSPQLRGACPDTATVWRR